LTRKKKYMGKPFCPAYYIGEQGRVRTKEQEEGGSSEGNEKEKKGKGSLLVGSTYVSDMYLPTEMEQ